QDPQDETGEKDHQDESPAPRGRDTETARHFDVVTARHSRVSDVRAGVRTGWFGSLAYDHDRIRRRRAPTTHGGATRFVCATDVLPRLVELAHHTSFTSTSADNPTTVPRSSRQGIRENPLDESFSAMCCTVCP